MRISDRASWRRLFRRMRASAWARPNVLDFKVAHNKYGAYCVPVAAKRRPAVRAVLAGKVWEEEVIDFVAAHCGAGGIVHAGAFFGDALPALSAAVDDAARVWAFEPNPESYRCAAITLLLNDVRNVTLRHAALGDTTETRQLVTVNPRGRVLGGASHLHGVRDADREPGNTLVPVDVVTIDAAVPADARISVVHLDIEQFEEYALAGAADTVSRNRPLLILETVPRADSAAGRLLDSLGYRTDRRLSGNVLLRCD
jgi:FkbM family methyltransferase